VGVKIKFLGGSDPPVTQISDSCNRGTLNPASGAPLWQGMQPLLILPFANPAEIAQATCGAAVDLGNAMSLTSFGSGNGPGVAYPAVMPCLGFTFAAVNGLTQFCQGTFVGKPNGQLMDGGPAIMINHANGANGPTTWYQMNYDSGTGTAGVVTCSVSGAVLSENTLFHAGATVLGDVWRLSFNVATATLTCSKNGTVVNTQVDGSPLSGGVPGWAILFHGANGGNFGNCQWRNWVGGIGL